MTYRDAWCSNAWRAFGAGACHVSAMMEEGPPRFATRTPEPNQMARPVWWEWEVELTSHLQKRMEDRDFIEVDLRDMLDRAYGYRLDVVPGRFIITTSFRGRRWEVIVEPDDDETLLVVVTAYPIVR